MLVEIFIELILIEKNEIFRIFNISLLNVIILTID